MGKDDCHNGNTILFGGLNRGRLTLLSFPCWNEFYIGNRILLSGIVVCKEDSYLVIVIADFGWYDLALVARAMIARKNIVIRVLIRLECLIVFGGFCCTRNTKIAGYSILDPNLIVPVSLCKFEFRR